MFKELKEFINRIYKEEHPKSELSDDLKKEIEEKLKGPHMHGFVVRPIGNKKIRERSKYNNDETK